MRSVKPARPLLPRMRYSLRSVASFRGPGGLAHATPVELTPTVRCSLQEGFDVKRRLSFLGTMFSMALGSVGCQPNEAGVAEKHCVRCIEVDKIVFTP